MRRLVEIATFLVVVTGFLVTQWLLGSQEIAIWAHLLLGFGYTVLFLLFSFDHIGTHLDLLKTLSIRSLSGMTQTVAGGVTLVSGFVLYLYGSNPFAPWTQIHLVGTVVFVVSVLSHIFFARGLTR